MKYYKYKDAIMFSFHQDLNLPVINQEEAEQSKDQIYFLNKLPTNNSRRTFKVVAPYQLFLKQEGLNLLQYEDTAHHLPDFIIDRINQKKVISINTNYANWTEALLHKKAPQKWKINIVGLGDVGSTLLTGLRLLGEDCIREIGIYDRNDNSIKRWYQEINQIHAFGKNLPPVNPIDYEDAFNCDMFVFCIAARVPAIGEEKTDVRMVQFHENSKILASYGRLAREKNYKGIFAVVSDPVDLLCSSLLKSSNLDDDGNVDDKGLIPDQIIGYGLGVMNGRGLYFSKESKETLHYEKEGRAYGPHGEGLIIADSIENYNQELSLYLTDKAKKANLEIRSLGFKPYVAPALSSGALSILATLKGEWHYSANYMGGIYMGALNRLHQQVTEIEALKLHPALVKRISETYQLLEGYKCYT